MRTLIRRFAGAPRALPFAACGLYVITSIYAVLFFRTLLAAQTYLERDNKTFHQSMFVQIAGYLRHVGAWPAWMFNQEGGVWTAVLANNFLLTAPHKILEYLWAYGTHTDLNVIYKTGYALAVCWIFASYWLLVRRTVPAFRFRFLLYCAFFLFSALNVALWHQEQAVATLFWAPSLAILALRFRARPSLDRACLFAAVLGLALNLHYPQIIFISGVCVVVAYLFSYPTLPAHPNLGAVRSAVWAMVAGAVVVVTAAPLLYGYFKYGDQLVSGFRGVREVQAGTYAAFLEMNRGQLSSVHPLNLLNYLGPVQGFFPHLQMARLDDGIFKLPAVTFPLILAAAVWAGNFRRENRFLMVLCALLLVTSTGVFNPLLPLYWYTVPGIGIFRQWYHFLPLLNLALGVLFFRAVAGLLPVLPHAWRSGGAVLFLTALVAAVHGPWLLRQRFELTSPWPPASKELELLDQRQFLNELLFNSRGLLRQSLVRVRGAKTSERVDPIGLPVDFTAGADGGKIRLNLPSSMTPMKFSQFNDGGWAFEGVAQVNPEGVTEFPQAGRITISRRTDPWLILVVSAYLVLILVFTWSVGGLSRVDDGARKRT